MGGDDSLFLFRAIGLPPAKKDDRNRCSIDQMLGREGPADVPSKGKIGRMLNAALSDTGSEVMLGVTGGGQDGASLVISASVWSNTIG